MQKEISQKFIKLPDRRRQTYKTHQENQHQKSIPCFNPLFFFCNFEKHTSGNRHAHSTTKMNWNIIRWPEDVEIQLTPQKPTQKNKHKNWRIKTTQNFFDKM